MLASIPCLYENCLLTPHLRTNRKETLEQDVILLEGLVESQTTNIKGAKETALTRTRTTVHED